MIPTAALLGAGGDPVLSGNEGTRSIHAVQFYEDDDALIDRLAEFFGTALGSGQACVMIATSAHRLSLMWKLQKRGLNVQQIVDEGRFCLLDAAETLATFSVRGEPKPAKFFEVMSDLLTKMAEKGQGRQRMALYGEMVGLLWEQGKSEAAVHLEAMWNALGKQHLFSLLCGYPMRGFGTEEDEAPFQRLCSEHSHALPCESYARLVSEAERMRLVCQLQQKAVMAEVALERQRIVESDLKEVEEMAQTLLEDSQGTVAAADLRRMLEPLSESLSMAKTADGMPVEAYSHLESAEELLAKLGRLAHQDLNFTNPRWRN